MTRFTASTVAFIGLGLISGSLARALRASEWQGRLLAWGPRAPSLERGLALGVIDEYSLVFDDVVAQADIIVVGAPPVATAEVLKRLGEYVADSSHRPIITDLASIKGYVVNAMPHNYSRFVPAHPIAGSEHSGVEHSDATLFRGREVILTPLTDTQAEAVEQVASLWSLTGAYVQHMSVDDHDELLALSSHMPHMVAYALTHALAHSRGDPMVHGGGALRDMTRIAGSDPLMWTDIARTNQAALLSAIDAFETEMAQLRAYIEKGDTTSMNAYFSACRAHRRAHDPILNPKLPDSSEDPS